MFLCLECWSALFEEIATSKIVKKFGISEEAAKELAYEANVYEDLPCPTRLGICQHCGRAGKILCGLFTDVVFYSEEKADENVTHEEESKPIRTMNIKEYETLRSAIILMNLHRQALDESNENDCEENGDKNQAEKVKQRRLPDLPTDCYDSDRTDDYIP